MDVTELTMNAEAVIAHFALVSHPEGGFYRRACCRAGDIPPVALPNAAACIHEFCPAENGT